MTYSIPVNSKLPASGHHYMDTFSITLNRSHDVLQVVKAMFLSIPDWIKAMMVLRNTLVSGLGLKTSSETDDYQKIIEAFDGKLGSSIGLFHVFDRSDHEIILGENDQHLDFRASLLLTPSKDKQELAFTTTVVFNNTLGKVYFAIVKPFHVIVVKSMLKATKKYLEQGG